MAQRRRAVGNRSGADQLNHPKSGCQELYLLKAMIAAASSGSGWRIFVPAFAMSPVLSDNWSLLTYRPISYLSGNYAVTQGRLGLTSQNPVLGRQALAGRTGEKQGKILTVRPQCWFNVIAA